MQNPKASGRAAGVSDVEDAAERLRREAEERLADHPERNERLALLRRRMRYLEDPRERAAVYLRELAELGHSPDEQLVAAFDDDVINAVGLLTHREGESYADVVLRSAQHELAREVLANDVGEELDRLARLRDRGEALGDRWDLLILCQALLDRAATAHANDAQAEPVVIETDEHVATVYLHPVHGDVVVLVRPVAGDEAREQWVLIDKAHKSELLLGLVGERLREPVESGLIPWLRDRKMRHHVYDASETDDGGTALA